jgi:hypothetical protein
LTSTVIKVSTLVASLMIPLRHRWQGHSLWQIWKRVDQLSPLLFAVVE